MRFVSQCDLFSLKLERDGEGAATVRIPVLPEGQFSHPFYGELNWTPDRFTRMIQNHQQGVTGYAPMLNFDHATHNPYAQEAPAAGWIQALEHVPGEGLFAVVELTDLGEAAIQKKRYRYASAEVAGEYANSRGQTAEDVISGLALTNTPFHGSMPGLFGQPKAAAQCFSTRGPATFWAAKGASPSMPPTPDPQLLAQFTQELQARPQRFGMDGEMSHEECRMMLSNAVRAEMGDADDQYAYVLEVYPSFFIYEVDTYEPTYTEKYYQRAYAVSNGAVMLGADKTEVERTWRVKAQAAYRAALAQVKQFEAGHSGAASGEAGSPAERKPSMTLLEKARKFFRLPDTATEEEAVAAFERVPAPAPAVEPPSAEPPTETQQHSQAAAPPADTVTLSRTELAELQRRAASADHAEAARVQSEQQLARERATASVDAYVNQGVLLPAQREDAIEFALESPARFQALYSAAQPQLDTQSHGRQGGGDAEPPAPAGDPFRAEVDRRFKAATDAGQPADWVTIASQVALEKPELYRAHRGGRVN